MPFVRVAAALLLAFACWLIMTGCGDDAATPGEQLDEAIEKSEEAQEQASEAIDQMKAEGEKAREQVEDLSAKARDLARQQVTLMKEQLDSFGDRISKLPAEKEQVFSARLAECCGR